GPNTATIQLAGLNLVVNTANTGALNIDTIAGGFDELNVQGTAGNDVVTSTANAITVNGNKAVTVGAGGNRVIVNTFAGSDNISLALALPGVQKTVNAGDGDDIVNLSATTDAVINGGAGDDFLTGSPGADQIFAGSGNDFVFGLGGT